eukprot:2994081-Prymnesium_polylepis.1
MLQSCVGRPSLSAIPAGPDPSVDIAEELFDDFGTLLGKARRGGWSVPDRRPASWPEACGRLR